MNQKNKRLSYEYIRGLIEGEGSFSFSSIPVGVNENGEFIKKKLPAFMLQMSKQDHELMELVKETMGLKNRIYEYKTRKSRDGYNRQPMMVLIVRDFGQMKNIIVPFFNKRLHGNKAKQFEIWMEKMGNDPNVNERYKFIYKIYKEGFYDRNPSFID